MIPLHPSARAALESNDIRRVLFWDFAFNSAAPHTHFRISDSDSTFVWGGVEWIGAASLFRSARLDGQQDDLAPTSLRASLLATPEIVRSVFSERYRGVQLTVHLGLFADNRLLTEALPFPVWRGYLEDMSVNLSKDDSTGAVTQTIDIQALSILAGWDGATGTAYSKASQRARYPEDGSFDNISEAVNRNFFF